jgi:hypothetical protein
MAFDAHSEALVTCTEHAGLQHWMPRQAAVAAPGVFGGDCDPVRKTEWHVTVQAECRARDVAAMVSVGGALALLYIDGGLEWRALPALDVVAITPPAPAPAPAGHGHGQGAAHVAAGVSCNQACVAVVDAHAGLRIIEAGGAAAGAGQDDAAGHYVRLYETALAGGNDSADITLGVRGHHRPDLCVDVAQQLEARRAAAGAGAGAGAGAWRAGAGAGMYGPGLHGACAALYGMAGGAWASNSAAHVLRLGVDAALACLRGLLLAPAATDVRRALEGADEAAVDAVAEQLVMDMDMRGESGRVRVRERLEATGEWAVQCAVLVLHSVHAASRAGDARISITAATVPRLISEAGLPAVGLGVLLDGLDNIRELLVYALHIRRRAEHDRAGLPSKAAAIRGLYKAFTALGAVADPIYGMYIRYALCGISQRGACNVNNMFPGLGRRAGEPRGGDARGARGGPGRVGPAVPQQRVRPAAPGPAARPRAP